MEHQDSLPCSRESFTCSHNKAYEYSQSFLYAITQKPFLILSSHLRTDLPCGLFQNSQSKYCRLNHFSSQPYLAIHCTHCDPGNYLKLIFLYNLIFSLSPKNDPNVSKQEGHSSSAQHATGDLRAYVNLVPFHRK
jgi:hypothetical protein